MSDEQLVSEADILFDAVEAEPLEKPTEEAAEEVNDPEETNEELVGEESEESEGEETEELEEDEQLVVIGETEHNLDEVQEWKDAFDNTKSMQADCTKKWQEASELKKQAEALGTKNQDLSLELEVLINEDKEIDLKELKEYDLDEYVKVTERLAKREKALSKLRANQPVAKAPLTEQQQADEYADFFAHNKAWLEDGKVTEVFNTDMAQATAYLKELGFGDEEINGITESRYLKAFVDASKYKAVDQKVKTIKKKIRKAPSATKPVTTEKAPVKSDADILFN